MRTILGFAAAIILTSGVATPVGGSPTPHRIPVQGYVTDDLGAPLADSDLTVLIHDAASDGNLVYSSGTDFAGAVQDGVLDVDLGSTTPLLLSDTDLHYMTISIDGIQIIGETAGGRYAFYPGGGDHARPDLEERLDDLEAIFAGGKSGAASGAGNRAIPLFGESGAVAQLEYGLLGVGVVTGATLDVSVVGNLLLQPVGIFSMGGLVLELGPFHIPQSEIDTGIVDPDLPARTAFLGCSPNPFNPRTTVRFDLAVQTEVRIGVYDLAGRLVRRLLDGGELPAGRHRVLWQGRDEADRQVAAGIYVVRFTAGEVLHNQTVTLLK